jgi:hypothetical protein
MGRGRGAHLDACLLVPTAVSSSDWYSGIMPPSEAPRDWLDRLCEVEAAERTRKHQIAAKSNLIFQQLRDEISRIVDRYNTSHPTGTASPAVGFHAAGDSTSHTARVERNRDLLVLKFPINDGYMEFEHSLPGPSFNPEHRSSQRAGITEIEIVPPFGPGAEAVIRYRVPEYEIRTKKMKDEVHTTQSLVEYLLKPVLFPEEILAVAEQWKTVRFRLPPE